MNLAWIFRARARARARMFGIRGSGMIAARTLDTRQGPAARLKIEHEDEHEHEHDGEVTGKVPTP
jgi:hypothetical protein